MLLPIVLTIIAVFALASLAALRFLGNPVVSRSSFDEDAHLQAVAQRCWETGKMQLGTVEKDGSLTIKQVD